jgi:hypothetical protein
VDRKLQDIGGMHGHLVDSRVCEFFKRPKLRHLASNDKVDGCGGSARVRACAKNAGSAPEVMFLRKGQVVVDEKVASDWHGPLQHDPWIRLVVPLPTMFDI